MLLKLLALSCCLSCISLLVVLVEQPLLFCNHLLSALVDVHSVDGCVSATPILVLKPEDLLLSQTRLSEHLKSLPELGQAEASFRVVEASEAHDVVEELLHLLVVIVDPHELAPKTSGHGDLLLKLVIEVDVLLKAVAHSCLLDGIIQSWITSCWHLASLRLLEVLRWMLLCLLRSWILQILRWLQIRRILLILQIL